MIPVVSGEPCAVKAARTVRRALEGNVSVYGLITRPPSTLFFLIHLGLNGDEFKTARMHLLHAMPGDAAWKHGRPKTKSTGESRKLVEVGNDTL